MIELRPLEEGDVAEVSAMAIRSKASWGYAADEMEIFSEELTLDPAAVRQFLAAQVAIEEGEIVGYFALVSHLDGNIELEFLFVDPARFGQGIGTALLDAALAAARDHGVEKVILISDPNASGFYLRHGAEKIGDHQSSIAGRTIPVFSIAL